MKYLRCFSIFLVALISAAQSTPQKGSISGIIQEAGTGSPIVGAHISRNSDSKSAESDATGRYLIKDLPARSYKVYVYSTSVLGPHGKKFVHLAPGQDLTVSFSLPPKATISGRIVDENGEPVPKVSVFLIAREYNLEALRYTFANAADTDDEGHYDMKGIEPGRGYLIEAIKHNLNLPSISDAPADPKLRKRATVPTFYPDADSSQAAEIVVLQPSEHRESADIKLKRSASYCLDGVLESDRGPAKLNFFLEEKAPSSGMFDDGGFFTSAPYGQAGADGRIRVCNLHPGDYRLSAYAVPGFFGQTEVSIADKDIHEVKVFGRPRIAVAGEFAWDGRPPDKPFTEKVLVSLQPMTRAYFEQEFASTTPPASFIPGQFNLPGIFADDYSLRVIGVPNGVYIKDIIYGGRSILHEPMQVGKAMGSDLRIIFAHDGGILNVKVADKDNNPIPDCKVVLLPDNASTEAALADSMIQGQTDQYGAYKSAAIPPGKYFVLATTGATDHTPETIAKLMRARTHAQEVELQPSASTEIALTPLDLN